MRTQKNKKCITVSILGVFLLTACMVPAFAQTKLQKSPGGYHGELDFPLSWKRYYSYAEWTKIMHDMQKKISPPSRHPEHRKEPDGP